MKVYDKLSFMRYVPILFISAKTGKRIDKLFDFVNSVKEQSEKGSQLDF